MVLKKYLILLLCLGSSVYASQKAFDCLSRVYQLKPEMVIDQDNFKQIVDLMRVQVEERILNMPAADPVAPTPAPVPNVTPTPSPGRGSFFSQITQGIKLRSTPPQNRNRKPLPGENQDMLNRLSAQQKAEQRNDDSDHDDEDWD